MQVDECKVRQNMSAEFVVQRFYSGRLICGDTDDAELDTLRHADIPIKSFADLQSCPKYNRGLTIALAACICRVQATVRFAECFCRRKRRTLGGIIYFINREYR